MPIGFWAIGRSEVKEALENFTGESIPEKEVSRACTILMSKLNDCAEDELSKLNDCAEDELKAFASEHQYKD